MEALNNLPVDVDLKEVRRNLHLDRSRDLQLLQRLMDAATPLIKPKAAFKVCYIEKKLKDSVIVDGLHLKSKVLRKNLDPTRSVSGIYFQSEVSFLSCQLCQRGRCPGRKARYDEKRAREYGVLD